MKFPILITDRLILRQLKMEDDNEIFIMRSDKQILKYLNIPVAKNIIDARNFIEKINNGIANNDWNYWGITLKNNDKLIGTICLWNISVDKLNADAGYVLLNDFQGHGFMQEALVKIIDYGFHNMNLIRIDADVDPKNSRSIKLLVKLNFIRSKTSENTEIYTLAKNKKQNPEYENS